MAVMGSKSLNPDGFMRGGTDMKAAEVSETLLLNRYKRTHRWDRIQRHEDELVQGGIEDTIGRTLFATDLDTLGLYNKPMARNSQLWTMDSQLLLDGPNATYDDLNKAALTVARGGSFHYRFQFPPMRSGPCEIYWQLPLCAFYSISTDKMEMLERPLTGYCSAYDVEKTDLSNSVEIWPNILRREPYLLALRNFEHLEEHYRHQTSLNIIRILDTFQLREQRRLPADFARRILKLS